MKHCRLTRYVRHWFGLFFLQNMAEPKKQIDWEKIELDYRAGIKSVREIASSHGITHGAINKRAKRDKWDRDLAARIKAKADALVSKAEVSKEVSKESLATERETVEANAQAIATVRLNHRKDISRLKELSCNMLEELSGQTIDLELFEKLGELMFSPDEKGFDKLNELYRKVIATPSRIDSMKKLTETFKHLIALEREAWGIDGTEEKPKDSGEILLEALSKLTSDDSRLSLPGRQ